MTYQYFHVADCAKPAGRGEVFSRVSAFLVALLLCQLSSAQILQPIQELYDGLRDLEALVMTSDGTHLYAVGDDNVWGYSRDAESGEIDPLSSITNGQQGLTGLVDAIAADMSPDDRNIYIAADNALVVLSRDTDTGALGYVQTLVNGENDVDGVNGILDVQVSPDGANVYAVSEDDTDSFLIGFARDAQTGSLTQILAVREGIGGVTGLAGPNVLALDPEGAHIYVASHVNNVPATIAVFLRDAVTGLVTLLESYVRPDDFDTIVPNAIAVSSDGLSVYLADACCGEKISVLARDPDTGLLTSVENIRPSGSIIGSGGSVAVTPDGSKVLVGARNPGVINIFERNQETGALTFVEVLQDGVDGITRLARPSAIVIAPDSEKFYVTSSSESAVVAFEPNPFSGRAQLVEEETQGFDALPSFENPLDASFSPDGRQLYVSTYDSSVLHVLERDPSTGLLTLLEQFANQDSPVGIAVTPDGRNVYIQSRLDLLAYERSLLDGTLSRLPNIAANTFNFIRIPNDRFIYIGNGGNLTTVGLTLVDRNAAEQTVVERGRVAGSQKSDLTFSPDGLSAYATGPDGILSGGRNSINTYAVDPVDGSFEFLQSVDINSVEDLLNPQAVTVAPGGAHVYVANAGSNAVSVFERSPIDGTLSFVSSRIDGVAGVDGIEGAIDVELSPNGTLVYATGQTDDAIAVFSRDAVTGTLLFEESTSDGSDGAFALDGATSILVSPDGEHVYVLSREEDAIQAFKAEPPALVSGRVIDAITGNGLGCATIVLASLSGGGEEVTVAGENGNYFFDRLAPGIYDVTVFAPGYQTVMEAALVVPESSELTRDFSMTRLADVVTISGQLTEVVQQGTSEVRVPLVAVRVELNLGASETGTTFTCGDGRYEFVISDDGKQTTLPAQLDFSLPNYDSDQETRDFVSGQDLVVDNELQKRAGIQVATATGSVFELLGADFEVSNGARVTFEGATNLSVFTGPDGFYEATIVEGRNTITASKVGFEQDFTARDVPAGAVSEADFELAPIGMPTIGASVAELDFTTAGGSLPFTVSNSGTGTLLFETEIVDGEDWLTVAQTKALTAPITLVATAEAYEGAEDRQAIIRITSERATNAPLEIAVTQEGTGIVITDPEDVDRNGVIDVVDVQIVVNAALGLFVEPGINADVNRDDAVNAVDVQETINAALGDWKVEGEMCGIKQARSKP